MIIRKFGEEFSFSLNQGYTIRFTSLHNEKCKTLNFHRFGSRRFRFYTSFFFVAELHRIVGFLTELEQLCPNAIVNNIVIK